MPKTVTLSDEDLAVLQAMRPIVGDVPHPARPSAVALIDRIVAAPADELRWPTHSRSGAQPMDLSQPDGHRCSSLSWDNTLGTRMADIAIPAGGDLHLALMRPGDTVVMRYPLDAGDPEDRRALYRLSCSAATRPLR